MNTDTFSIVAEYVPINDLPALACVCIDGVVRYCRMAGIFVHGKIIISSRLGDDFAIVNDLRVRHIDIIFSMTRGGGYVYVSTSRHIVYDHYGDTLGMWGGALKEIIIDDMDENGVIDTVWGPIYRVDDFGEPNGYDLVIFYDLGRSMMMMSSSMDRSMQHATITRRKLTRASPP